MNDQMRASQNNALTANQRMGDISRIVSPDRSRAQDEPAKVEMKLPSYSKFVENQNEIQDTEHKWSSLQVEKKNLQFEFDRLPSTRAKTYSDKQRKQELEGKLEELQIEIGKMKRKLRDFNAIQNF